MKKLLKSHISNRASSLKGNAVVGIAMGCIYNVLANQY